MSVDPHKTWALWLMAIVSSPYVLCGLTLLVLRWHDRRHERRRLPRAVARRR